MPCAPYYHLEIRKEYESQNTSDPRGLGYCGPTFTLVLSLNAVLGTRTLEAIAEDLRVLCFES